MQITICLACGRKFRTRFKINGKDIKRTKYCLKCLPLCATKKQQLLISNYGVKTKPSTVTCGICKKNFFRNSVVNGKGVKRRLYCLDCIPIDAPKNIKDMIVAKHMATMYDNTRGVYHCIICGKRCPCYIKIDGKEKRRNRYCYDCMPLGLSAKDVGRIVGIDIVRNHDAKSNNTFKCTKCGLIIRKNIGHRNDRLRRGKYCDKCLPKGTHPKTIESLNGTKMICRDCGNEFIFKSNVSHNTTTTCYACWRKRKQRELKQKAIKLGGECCQLCGYNRYPGSLTFHHINPSKKKYDITRSASNVRMLVEIKKCVLLCTNCHQEVHGGITKVPKRIVNKWVSKEFR